LSANNRLGMPTAITSTITRSSTCAGEMQNL
jgi:hypothetical protein